MIEFITTHSWIVWVAVALLLLIVEMLTLDFIFLMLAGGTLLGLVADLLGAPWWLSIVIAAVAALLLIAFIRRPLRNALHRSSGNTVSNVDAITGSPGIAVSTITELQGQARLSNGETWTARSATGTIAAGTALIVDVVAGAHVIVRASGE